MSNTPNLRRTLLGAEKSFRYHMRRQAFFESWTRRFNFLTILLGSGTIYAATSGTPVLVASVGAVVAVIGAIQLVWDLGRAARDHENLKVQFSNLLAEIKENNTPDDVTISKWESLRERIESCEFATYNALEADCRNEVVRVYYDPESASKMQLAIPWYARKLMHYFRYESWEFKPRVKLG